MFTLTPVPIDGRCQCRRSRPGERSGEVSETNSLRLDIIRTHTRDTCYQRATHWVHRCNGMNMWRRRLVWASPATACAKTQLASVSSTTLVSLSPSLVLNITIFGKQRTASFSYTISEHDHFASRLSISFQTQTPLITWPSLHKLGINFV